MNYKVFRKKLKNDYRANFGAKMANLALLFLLTVYFYVKYISFVSQIVSNECQICVKKLINSL